MYVYKKYAIRRLNSIEYTWIYGSVRITRISRSVNLIEYTWTRIYGSVRVIRISKNVTVTRVAYEPKTVIYASLKTMFQMHKKFRIKIL